MSRILAFALFSTLLAGHATNLSAHDSGQLGGEIFISRDPYDGPGFLADTDAADGLPIEFPSKSTQLLSWVTIPELAEATGLGALRVSDCWGHTSSSGREYALICTDAGLAVVDLTEPGAAKVVGGIEGPGSDWHDVKSYGDYAYVVSESFFFRGSHCGPNVEPGMGIQVIDLTRVDEGIVELVGNVVEEDDARTHNVAVDPVSGYLYRCGGTVDQHSTHANAGLRVYDLTDPRNPLKVGEWNEIYVHDAQIVTYPDSREIAFCCVFEQSLRDPDEPCFGEQLEDTRGLAILDVSDKSNIRTLSVTGYPRSFYPHQGWLSEDRKHFFLGDEFDEFPRNSKTSTHVFNVENLEDPSYLGKFGYGTISTDHNLVCRDGYVFEANYSAGLQIFDARDVTDVQPYAHFDTDPQEDRYGYLGLWGVYPLFDSRIVIGSDTDKGLFVWWVGDPRVDIRPERSLDGAVIPMSEAGDYEIAFELSGDVADVEPGSVELWYRANDALFAVPAIVDPKDPSRYVAKLAGFPPGSRLDYLIRARTTDAIEWREPVYGLASSTLGLPDGCEAATASEVCTSWSARQVGASLPGGWSFADDTCLRAAAPAGTIHPTMAGDDVSYAFLHRSVEGNFDFVVRLSEWPRDVSGQFALTARESLSRESREHMILLDTMIDGYEHSSVTRFRQDRPAVQRIYSTYDDPELWLRVARRGFTLSSAISLDGSSWRSSGAQEIDGLEDRLYVGFAVSRREGFGGLPTSIVEVCGIRLGTGEARPFIRGDCNDDARIDLSDAVCLLGWFFLDGVAPLCERSANVNADRGLDIADAIYLLNHLFLGAAAPLAPFPDCGLSAVSEDETFDCSETPRACR